MTIRLTITETTLSDGSIVYGLLIGGTEVACVDEAAAIGIANAIEDGTVDTQFDGGQRVKRAA